MNFIPKSTWFGIIAAALILFASPVLLAADTYVNKDVAIFQISIEAGVVDPDFAAGIASSLQAVFTSMGRFNVLFYGNYQLSSGDISAFIDQIRMVKAQGVQSTVDQKFGNLVIDGDTFKKLASSFYVIVPSITRFYQSTETSGSTLYYKTEATVTITIIDVAANSILKTLMIDLSERATSGYPATIGPLISSFKSRLTSELKKIDAFQLKAGVIKVDGNRVYLDLGGKSGVRPGYEFLVISKEKIGNDFIEHVIGLIRIVEISNNIAIAEILIQDKKITEGDQLKELPRSGFDAGFAATFGFVDFVQSYYNGYTTFSGGLQSVALDVSAMTRFFVTNSMFVILGGSAQFTSPLTIMGMAGAGFEAYLFSRFSVGAFATVDYAMTGADVLNFITGANWFGSSTFGATAVAYLGILLDPASQLIVSCAFGLFVPITGVGTNGTSYYTLHDFDGNAVSLNLTGLQFSVFYLFRL